MLLRVRRLTIVIVAGLTSLVASSTVVAADAQQIERLNDLLLTGQYADASRLIDTLRKAEPSEELAHRPAIIVDSPNMRVQRAASGFECAVRGDGLWLPVNVGKQHVDWSIDTGAPYSMISNTDAQQLKFTIRASGAKAIAPTFMIGKTRFDNVTFQASGHQTILGLPIAIAFDTFRWTRSGFCEIAKTNRLPASEPNLRYERLRLVVTATFSGKELEFAINTGQHSVTELWERFTRDNAQLVGRATLPELQLSVGGSPLRLENIPLVQGDDASLHGQLGMDVLTQASEVTIDFRAMTFTLHR